jgi:hypothetical protein
MDDLRALALTLLLSWLKWIRCGYWATEYSATFSANAEMALMTEMNLTGIFVVTIRHYPPAHELPVEIITTSAEMYEVEGMPV